MIRASSGAGARVPAAILMSGTGSNARKLLEYSPPGLASPAYEVRVILSDNPDSNYRRIGEEFGVPARLHDIYAFCGAGGPGGRERLRDPELRRAFDAQTLRLLGEYHVRLVAAAGYDWVISSELCAALPIVNVHPGDLRVRDEQGRRRYVGLGWIPTARAILNGESSVRSTTHLVTAELDGGPIARVSRAVPVELLPGVTPGELLPPGTTLGEVIRDLRRGGGRFGNCRLVTLSRNLQERLKAVGDWVELPRTLHGVAELVQEGRLSMRGGALSLDGRPIEDLFLQGDDPPEGAN
jgi:folate-dependent phosphoribosylglycinamide formyltransferase PurN